MGTIAYEQDLVAWANEQARLLRAGRFDQLDLEHLAEEIEGLKGKLADARWWEAVWRDATDLAAREAGLSEFAEACPWTMDEVMNQEWIP